MERRPWWLLLFALPLCCGASLVGAIAGFGGAGILGGAFLGGALTGPTAALGMGSLFGASLAIPLILLANRHGHVHEDGCGCAHR